MKNFTKTITTNSLYSLVNRLQKHSEWKYPNREWTVDTYYDIAFQWMGKEKELEKRVLKLENEMNQVKSE